MKLRSAEEVYDDYCTSDGDYRWDLRFNRVLEADRDAVRQVCAVDAEAFYCKWVSEHDINASWTELRGFRGGLKAAILSAGKVDEKRERLAKVYYNAGKIGCSWDELPRVTKDECCASIDAVLAEQAKIQEEADG